MTTEEDGNRAEGKEEYVAVDETVGSGQKDCCVAVTVVDDYQQVNNSSMIGTTNLVFCLFQGQFMLLAGLSHVFVVRIINLCTRQMRFYHWRRRTTTLFQ